MSNFASLATSTILVLAALALAIAPPNALAEESKDSKDSKQPKISGDKVTICHKGKNTISVSANAVHAHLAHGDILGPCEVTP